MSTCYLVAASIDGYIATLDHQLDWLLALGDGSDTLAAFIREVGAIAMGANTYRWLLAHHRDRDTGAQLPWPYSVPTWLFSHQPLPSFGGGAVIHRVTGDPCVVHSQMELVAAGKTCWIVGGGDLAAQFVDAGLIDELRVTIVPVVLGRGQPLLPRRLEPPAITLSAVKPLAAGMVELCYQIDRTASR
jgi:dihydrofolate reductase